MIIAILTVIAVVIWFNMVIAIDNQHPNPAGDLVTYVKELHQQVTQLTKLAYAMPIFVVLTFNALMRINVFESLATFMTYLVAPILFLFAMYLFDKHKRTRMDGYNKRFFEEKKAGTPQDLNRLQNIVNKLAKKANMPAPKVLIGQDILPFGDFYAGATVTSKGEGVIMAELDFVQSITKDELYAVLAHETSHLKNGDLTSLLSLGALGSVPKFMLFFGMFFYSWLFTSNGHELATFIQELAIVLFGTYLIWAVIFGWLKMAISRKIEYAADSCAAYLVGKKPMLALLSRFHQEEQKKLKEAFNGNREREDRQKKLINRIAGHPTTDLRASAILQLNCPDTFDDMPIN
jgi:heat shock protein HtpX